MYRSEALNSSCDTLYLAHATADGVAELMRRYMQIFHAPTPPEATSSFGECRFCDLAGRACLDAIDEAPETVTVGWF